MKEAQRPHAAHERAPLSPRQPAVTRSLSEVNLTSLPRGSNFCARKRTAVSRDGRKRRLWTDSSASVHTSCLLGVGRHWGHDLQTAEKDKDGGRVAFVFVDRNGKTNGAAGAATPAVGAAVAGKDRLPRRHSGFEEHESEGKGHAVGRLYTPRDLISALERAVTDVGHADRRRVIPASRQSPPSLTSTSTSSETRGSLDLGKRTSDFSDSLGVGVAADVHHHSDAGKENQTPRSDTVGKRVRFLDVDAVVKARLHHLRATTSAYVRRHASLRGVRGRRNDRVKTSSGSAAQSEEVDQDEAPPVSRPRSRFVSLTEKGFHSHLLRSCTVICVQMYRKFRMVGLIVMKLVRLKAAIAVNSQDRTVRSAAEIQWRTLYGQHEAEKLAFNKSYFSRERVSTKMPNWALMILYLTPEERTEHDCRRLHALFRGMRGFLKFTERIQLSLCRAFEYECVGEGRIVLRRGHVGHNFYFIYSGSVFVNVQDIDSEGQPFIKTEAVLGMGDSFGELALLQDIRRTATISVRETCELLVVEKEVFARVCPQIFDQELVEKQAFVSRMPLFCSTWWSPDSVRQLCMEAQIQEYKINKIVVEDNSREEWLYICMEGQCQVIRCLTLGAEEDDPLPCPERESVVLSEEILELLMKPKHSESSTMSTNEQDEDSKEKMLSSLRLEYVKTGKRRSIFIEEVEDEERRKVKVATSGPATLTSLIAQQQKARDSRQVFLHVDVLNCGGVFDMGSLIKAPLKKKTSKLLLVSSGARMFRVKKATFFRLASTEAIEHTRTLLSQQRTPSEAELLDSYKQKMSWDEYKSGVVHEVILSRDLRLAPQFRSNHSKPHTSLETNSKREQKRASSRLITALHHFTDVERRNELARQSFSVDDTSDNSGLATTDGERRKIFPVEEVDEETEQSDDETEGFSTAVQTRKSSIVADDNRSPRPVATRRPSTVVVRRRSSLGNGGQPIISSESSSVAIRQQPLRPEGQLLPPTLVVVEE
ncbi:hypothetical protein C0Q70_08700 [Pomacea canaliculata]|uniref:Cyclic nucleotide-binding domain-containing protein n=1 Tax=Pomacea canaliculata TaxID=400727 RepID=A0A2T7P7R5_POMCA|nr:hypothetical protein C0Q70_08700 [Pomacea canaliculata]